MLSINTNLSSLIAQESMKKSTNKLDIAIERMTTGLKINHAKDNAANYSISTNMTTQLNAYQVAEDNVAMGMDLVNTASDIISQMQDKGERLRALATQARNGTYGIQSLDALNAEASAIINEINRLYSTSEYNGIDLFNRKICELPTEHKALNENLKAKAEYNGFIDNPVTHTQAEVEALDSIVTFTEGANGKYKIMSDNDLAKLADIVNSGKDTTGATFVMGTDIDLTEWQAANGDWVPIGGELNLGLNAFKGTFDGNGHTISNLKINSSSNAVGLFGSLLSAIIKNLVVKDSIVNGKDSVGILVGEGHDGSIDNCYATGSVTGQSEVGGLVGRGSSISNSYATGSVTGQSSVGGLVGSDSSISNSYATGSVTGESRVGGLVGYTDSSISNSYATGSVTGESNVGGLVGYARSSISNSYATGSVTGESSVGGLLGSLMGMGQISFCYSSGVVSGQSNVSGLVGLFLGVHSIVLEDCAILSQVSGTSNVSTLLNVEILLDSVSINFTEVQYSAQDGIELVNTSKAYDLTTALAEVSAIKEENIKTYLQVGTYGNDSSSLSFDTNLDFDLSALIGNIQLDSALSSIDTFINQLSEKSTILGAVQNRLDSALESISVNIENLASSRSTIRDADIAKESAEYIQQQILQQAAATLMSTANQSPSIALQLI